MAFLCSFGLCSSSSSSYHRLSSDSPPPSIPIVLLGSDQIFFVHPSLLDHWIFQDLLHSCEKFRRHHLPHNHRKSLHRWRRQNQSQSQSQSQSQNPEGAIFLNCDAILFEFFIWLVENDDPSLRELNLDDLLEFYGGSDQP